ncbi:MULTISPECIES: methyltransferase [Vibrio]|uniref:Ribosomal RNA large subunit methyltransferase G n=1 Tax=Vibrio algicola TaxID=2662262 RepID=A0A5Q0TC82_9VIBR|nr:MULTISPECIES: methyltransferase [Vibrio]MBD1575052.1 methyltransferase [Vibrio sp. S11_S32]
MNTLLALHDRELSLFRFPKRANETLQAWDAGDEYLINHITEKALPDGQNILILNDNFGALSCWFSEHHTVTMMSDSFISHRGALKNLQRNQCNRVKFLNCLDDIPAKIDLVLMQLPKSNRLLTWQLSKLRASLSADCPVIGVNKAKEIHTSTLDLFEKHLGTTTTSLAKKKHRLVFSHANCSTIHPVAAECEWPVDGEDIVLSNYANVYSGENLDLGARFMLDYLPQVDDLRHIIDLGCGNGILAIKAGQLNPQARITCIDESYMAVESAKKNLERNLGSERNIQVLANNCLDGMKQNSSFLVICNPPFHQQNAITDHIAWQMFCDAKDTLNHDGKLLVVGNRHLDYHIKLERLFGEQQVAIVAENSKFMIIEAIKNNDLKKNDLQKGR